MTNPLRILEDVATSVLEGVFGKREPLREIKVSGMIMPADYCGSVAEYIAMKKGLLSAKPLNSASNVPSVSQLREQLKPESARAEKNVFAKPVFRVYVSGEAETQLVTSPSCGDYAWR